MKNDLKQKFFAKVPNKIVFFLQRTFLTIQPRTLYMYKYLFYAIEN